MLSIKGTETEKNLLKSFAGESQARNRYTFFASAAKKEGFKQISEIFLATAEQEQAHAKRFFRFLEGGPLEINATYPAGLIGTTAENLKAAADGEYEEWSELYPHFAEVAATEGFKNVAAAYKVIAVAEQHHEAQYRKLFDLVSAGKFFEREVEIEWVCVKCGYVHKGKKALKVCPACLHPQGYFKALNMIF
jgi:rubrerythrin